MFSDNLHFDFLPFHFLGTGSSAGAGSGEFHVYRHLRRKEYARLHHIDTQARTVRRYICLLLLFILFKFFGVLPFIGKIGRTV